MAKIAETYFRVALAMSETDKAQLAVFLRATAADTATNFFDGATSVEARVEDGSIKVWVVVATASLAGLVEGYGALRQSIDYIIQDSQAFSEAVRGQLESTGIRGSEVAVFQRRLGLVGKIKRTLLDAEELENARHLKAEVRRARYEALKERLGEILAELGSADRALVIENLPKTVASKLERQPERAPPPESVLTALPSRPEDWDLNAATDMRFVAQTRSRNTIRYEPLVTFDVQSHRIVRTAQELGAVEKHD